MNYTNDTITALATPAGSGAIAIIRISGTKALEITAQIFESVSGKNIQKQKSHTVHLGYITDHNINLDQVLVTLFKGSNSYTGEETVEISCHGSVYIQQQILQLLIKKGCRMAQPGEFTLRAFLNGKLDLSQAEAVADLIASDNQANHQIAIQQMRGGFSNELKNLRTELLNFASLLELELDFSEEDVEFADRKQFTNLLDKLQHILKRLIDSFAVGNVLKNGIPVAIIGEPNVGKSTLLNTLLNEEKAIVSSIAGTTRDVIEDEITINGIGFRFIDTAGIRETTDEVETIGIQKTFEKIEQAKIILYLVDSNKLMIDNFKQIANELEKFSDKKTILIVNKIDALEPSKQVELEAKLNQQLSTINHQPIVILISAKSKIGIEELKNTLLSFVNTGVLQNNQTIVTNSRHFDALQKALAETQNTQQGLEQQLPSDLMAIDVRQILYHIGEITGEVTNDELLGNIFANFCIGK